MNYLELVAAGQAYADRYDQEVVDNMDNFLRFAEARINRLLKVREQSKRARLQTVDEQEYYPLPTDFAGMRDINIVTPGADGGESVRTYTYLNPEQMNIKSAQTTNGLWYTVIADQLQIAPIQAAGSQIEIIYYQRLFPLTRDNPTNWLSNSFPDIYLAALMLEIEAFVKNDQSVMLWESKFKMMIGELQTVDVDERWSGTPLTTKVQR